MEPACDASSIVHLGRAPPPRPPSSSRMPARRCWSSLGSAHGCHLPFRALGGDWEPIQHCSAQTSTALLKNKQPYTQSQGASDSPPCSPALAQGHISITWRAGTALLLQTKADYLLQSSISHSSRNNTEQQDSRCSCENHQWRHLILQLLSASMLELVNATIKPVEVMRKFGGFHLLLEGISTR